MKAVKYVARIAGIVVVGEWMVWYFLGRNYIPAGIGLAFGAVISTLLPSWPKKS